jgi:hypothetical protein
MRYKRADKIEKRLKPKRKTRLSYEVLVSRPKRSWEK